MIAPAITSETWLQGRSIVAGVAIGSIHFLCSDPSVSCQDGAGEKICPEVELQRFFIAVDRSQEELLALSQKLKDDGFCHEADIVDMHSILIRDVIFNREVIDLIQYSLKRADVAIFDFLQKYRTRFCHIPDVMMRQRFEDVESVCHRVLSYLVDQEGSTSHFNERSVIFAETAAATLICQSGIKQIKALVTKNGGAMSHTAIVAKAQGIPYVTGIAIESMNRALHGREVIVDGLAGLVIVDPADQTRRRYQSLKEDHDEFIKGDTVKPRLRARTKDGKRIFLYGNVASAQESHQLLNHGMDGIGLYRSEYLVLENRHFPNEEEQSDAFSQIVRASAGKSVVLRVFDFGDDKRWNEVLNAIPNFEEGRRTIALLLENPDLFLSHLKAMIRSSFIGTISILFPMVASIEEVLACLNLFNQACDMLKVLPQKRPRVGVMIEVPSMAFKIPLLKGKVQFLSLGTNDLLSHTLAVDRSDGSSLDIALQYHTGFLSLVSFIAAQSKEAGLPLCICGEMASDPLMIPFLIGLGIHQLSISPRLAPMVKHVLRSYSVDETEHIAQTVLALSSPVEADAYLKERYRSVYGG